MQNTQKLILNLN